MRLEYVIIKEEKNFTSLSLLSSSRDVDYFKEEEKMGPGI